MLTDEEILAAATPEKPKKLSDANGLHLLHMPNGRRGWRLKYYLHGSEMSCSFGPYDSKTNNVSHAREQANAARKLIKLGKNPATERRAERERAHVATTYTFAKAGAEFLELDDTRARRTIDKHRWLYGLLKPLHNRPLAEIDAPAVLKVLRAMEAQGKREAAHRCAQFVARVFRYAIQSGYCKVNPAADLRGALKKKIVESHAGVTDPKMFGLLMQLIDVPGAKFGYANVRNGLRLLARTALRPGELRQGQWSEINFEKAEWRIPASRMKMRREFLVPLSTQAIAVLREQHEITGDGLLIFPGVRSGRPMSDAAMGLALKLFIGADQHVPHGFRVSFSTIMNDRGWDSAIIELQLSHAKKDKVAGIYDRSQRNAERRLLMQAWSDLIDELKAQ